MGSTCNTKSSQIVHIKMHPKISSKADKSDKDPSQISHTHEKTGRPEFDEWEALSPGKKLYASSKLSMKAGTASSLSGSVDRTEIRSPMLPHSKKLGKLAFDEEKD